MKQIKTIMSLFCAAALFAACSSTDDLEPVVQTGQLADTETVSFDVYTRGTQSATRAGYVGEIDATTFQATGFGVYAYVTPGVVWPGTGVKPDFMANQYISYSSDGWTYSPVKYWPNQANTSPNPVDDLGGGTATTTTGIDYVSFFAYAPYVETTTVPYFGKDASTASTALAMSGVLDSSEPKQLKTPLEYDGILSLPAAYETGDPLIAYLVPANPAYGVDLMYGVAARGYTVNETTGKEGKAVTAGMPFKDLTKQVIGDKISYRFQHALTKLGINVDAYFDEVRDISHNSDVDANTRIVIESIEIKGIASGTPAKKQELYRYGHLNLNNTNANTPKWDVKEVEVTDLTSMIANGLMLVEPSSAVTDKETGAKYFALQPLGVTKTPKSLFGNDISGKGNATLMLIPGDDNADAREVSLTIKYHVITRDANLKTGVSDITNTITNSLGSIAMKAGSQTIINLHLGMTTMKFDAQVADWDGSNVKEVDLPANVAVQSITTAATVDKFGHISFGAEGTTVATYEGGKTQNLTINDVYFSKDAAGTEILDMVAAEYIPANYTKTARDIYLCYGGKSVKLPAQQPVLENSDFTLAVTTPVAETNIAAGGQLVTLTVTAASVMDFNCNDWNITADVAGISIEGMDSSAKTFNVRVPANPGSATRTITFTMTHKDTTNSTLTTSSSAKTQAAP